MKTEYYLKNIYAVAFLLMEQFQILRTEKSPKGFILFYFEDNEHLRNTLNRFYNDDNQLKQYIKNLIDVKALMKNA